MKPAAFDYLRAHSLQDACEWLARVPDARILAGGQSLLPILNMRLARPPLLIDISQTPDLAQMRVIGHADAMQLEVGAAVTQNALQSRPDLAQHLPLLHQALPWISHFQIRNQGTVCGSIAHADPSAELPLCLLALGGEIVLHRWQITRKAAQLAQRCVPAAQFFTGLLSTARQSDEVVSAVRFPLARAGQGFGFVEFAQRHGDFALCAVAAIVNRQAKTVRLAVGGMGDLPMLRDWEAVDAAQIRAAVREWAWELTLRDDAYLSAASRRHLMQHLAQQAIEMAQRQAEPYAGMNP